MFVQNIVRPSSEDRKELMEKTASASGGITTSNKMPIWGQG